MTASRELDMHVAIEVMGWVMLFDPEGSHWFERDGRRAHEKSTENPLPHYSTDIAAAWEVVEKVKALQVGTGQFVLTYDGDGMWAAGWTSYLECTFSCESRSESAPLAICLAALKAVGA